MADRDEERNLAEARLDAQFGELFHALNAQLWQRAHKWITAAKLFAGCAAFALLVDAVPDCVKILGALFISVTVIFDAVWRPLDNCRQHDEFGARYRALLASPDLDTVEKFDRALAPLDDSNVGLRSLDVVAYNRNVVSEGYPDFVQTLTLWQRFLSMLV